MKNNDKVRVVKSFEVLEKNIKLEFDNKIFKICVGLLFASIIFLFLSLH
mgnify:CR=1 FL=1